MKNKIPRIGVGTFLINEQNQILLGNRINSHGHDTWALPGGHLEFMETVEECSAREVLEETNLVIKDLKRLNFVNDFFEEEDKHYITVFTATRSYSGELKINEPHKCKCWKWFDTNELPDNLFKPLASFFNEHGFDL